MVTGRTRITTISGYISACNEETQVILKNIRDIIKESAPDAEGCICYGIPTFRLNGNLVHFAAHKSHLGFYPSPSGINAFKKEISKYKNSKGAVQFPLDEPIPYSLIKKIVKFRVKENLLK